MTTKIILPIILLLESVFVWVLLFRAKSLPYDENYGMLIAAFLLSLFTLAALFVIWFKRRLLIKEMAISIIIWILLGSPFTVVVLSIYYEVVFGKMVHGTG